MRESFTAIIETMGGTVNVGGGRGRGAGAGAQGRGATPPTTAPRPCPAAMTTSRTATPSDASPDEMVPGDLATARAFGQRIVEALALLK